MKNYHGTVQLAQEYSKTERNRGEKKSSPLPPCSWQNKTKQVPEYPAYNAGHAKTHLLRECHPRLRTTFCFPAAPFFPAAAMEEAVAIPPGMTASVPTPAWLLKYA